MKNTILQGYKYNTFDGANENVNPSVIEFQRVLDKAQDLIANECGCVIKALVNKGWGVDDVHGFYFQAIQHCLIRHNPEKANFVSFLRQKIQWLLESDRTNKARKKKQFEKIRREKVEFCMHGEVMPVDQIEFEEMQRMVEESELMQTELEL